MGTQLRIGNEVKAVTGSYYLKSDNGFGTLGMKRAQGLKQHRLLCVRRKHCIGGLVLKTQPLGGCIAPLRGRFDLAKSTFERGNRISRVVEQDRAPKCEQLKRSQIVARSDDLVGAFPQSVEVRLVV